jgi:ferric-dicitrate binding protein FerR (iron transport regulator)
LLETSHLEAASRCLNMERYKQSAKSREAAQWFVLQLDMERLSQEDNLEFRRWLLEAPEHVAELLKYQVLHRTLKRTCRTGQ